MALLDVTTAEPEPTTAQLIAPAPLSATAPASLAAEAPTTQPGFVLPLQLNPIAEAQRLDGDEAKVPARPNSSSGSDASIGSDGSVDGSVGEPEDLELTATNGLAPSEEREYVPGTFEGPEKNIEVCFHPEVGHPNGCRELPRAALDAICAAARCTILSVVSNSQLDAYVLSESSLFVFRHKMILKTCGTTTLLRCLHVLLRATKQLGLQLEWLGYSRKNFTFPDNQVFPHSSFEQEFQFLKKHPHLSARLNGSGYLLGPITGDHWLFYVANKCQREYLATERTINIMMFDLDPAVASQFYVEAYPTGKEMTTASGIAKLVPGAAVDDKAFEPCGYSMNAILYGSYTTVHITPEPECSYASFETNNPLKSYSSLLNNVLATFRPGRVFVTMTADEEGLRDMSDSVFDKAQLDVPGLGCFVNSCTSFTKVEGDCVVQVGNWEMQAETTPKALHATRQAHRPQSFS